MIESIRTAIGFTVAILALVGLSLVLAMVIVVIWVGNGVVWCWRKVKQ